MIIKRRWIKVRFKTQKQMERVGRIRTHVLGIIAEREGFSNQAVEQLKDDLRRSR